MSGHSSFGTIRYRKKVQNTVVNNTNLKHFGIFSQNGYFYFIDTLTLLRYCFAIFPAIISETNI